MKQQMKAFGMDAKRADEEAKPTLVMRLAALFGRPTKAPLERNPLTTEQKVLITNHSAMR